VRRNNRPMARSKVRKPLLPCPNRELLTTGVA
jgi:hypothetical protein